MSRWIGVLLSIGGLVGAVTLLFPADPFADVPMSVAVTIVAFTIGVGLLLGALDNAPTWSFQVVVALGIVLASFGVYSGGTPTSGAQLFYIWIMPYAYAFFSRRQAAAQTCLVAVSYGVVLTIQLHQHPAIGSTAIITGLWFLVVATAVVVGVIIRRISRSLRDIDRRVRRTFADSPIGAAFLSLELDVLQANDAFYAMLERDATDVIGQSLLEFLHPDDVGAVNAIVAVLGDRRTEQELRYLRADGETIFASVSIARVTPEIGRPYLFLLSLDISAQKRDREALGFAAIHDPLTGLYNRTQFLNRLSASLEWPETRLGELAVVILDLDRFKVVNDSLGHQIGDQVLMMIAPRLERAAVLGDTLARFGGDEFVLLCENLAAPEEALVRASALLNALVGPIELPVGSFNVSACVGIAVASARSRTAQSLIRDADAALYRAKREGRGHLKLFDESMRSEVLNRLALEEDLRAAIDNSELFVEFQPVIDIGTQRTFMLEALVRWEHPIRGRLLPNEFIKLAEESGYINELGAWVLSTALGHIGRWQALAPRELPLLVSVNVSGLQLNDPGFPARVAELALAHGVSLGSVGIEITESALIAHDTAVEALGVLRALGCTLLLDDFGTGYSSLSYLEQLPVTIVKVDRAFIARLGESRHPVIVLEAILAMCHALGLRVIAEGVEDEDQLVQLRELGCTLIQGHVLSAALSPEDVDAFLRTSETLAG